MLSTSTARRCTNITSSSLVAPLITSFVTDLEGNGLHFDRFVETSKVLSRDPKTRQLQLRDGCRFVYGGDLYDKGTHDMRLCKEMLSLKARYPDRVTFICGNRDLQKLKYLSMLHPRWREGRPISEFGCPYYMAGKGVTYEQFLAKRNVPNTEYSFLNWLVNYCYGAPNSLTHARQEMFEESVLAQYKADGTRKSYQELRDEFLEHVKAAVPSKEALVLTEANSKGAMGGVPFDAIRAFVKSRISEEEVVELYKCLAAPHCGAVIDASTTPADLDGIAKGNIVTQFADKAQLAAIHDGVLFVHGGIKAHIIGYVPDQSLEERYYAKDEELPGRMVSTLDEWVDGLNEFYSESLANWRKNPFFDEGALKRAGLNGSLADGNFPNRGGGPLFAYGHSRSTKGKSCMINSFFMDAKPAAGVASPSSYNDLAYVDMKTVSFLGLGGVSSVMAGHQPTSDVPLVIHQPGLRVVCADNNYCDGKGGRGEAVAEVLHDGEDGLITIHGQLVDGTPYNFTVDEDGPRVIGRRLDDGWWVRCELPDGKYLLRRTQDRFFTHESKVMTLDEIEAAIGGTSRILEREAVAGEDAPLPYVRDDLKPKRNHEKENPSIKTKRCCGSKDN